MIMTIRKRRIDEERKKGRGKKQGTMMSWKT
jgi:hypothetical protein